MSLIKPKSEDKKITFKVSINSSIAEEMKKYCEFAGFKSHDDFLEEAVNHILAKDKAFKKWQEQKTAGIHCGRDADGC